MVIHEASSNTTNPGSTFPDEFMGFEGREGPGSLFLNHNSKKIFTLYVIGNRFEITPSRFVIISAY